MSDDSLIIYEEEITRIDALMAKMLKGKIDLAAWQTMVREELRDLYGQSIIVVRGGVENMSKADWGRLGAAVQAQYKYLDRFAKQIEADAMAGKLKAPGYYLKRMAMYVNDASVAYWRTLVADAKKAKKTVLVYWETGFVKTEHCPDCAALAAASPYKLSELKFVPRDGHTACRMACGCGLRFSSEP